MSSLAMHTERTPNPASVKWVLGRELVEGASPLAFDTDVIPGVSPLAARVMAVDGVCGLLIGPDFLTVTKSADAGWREIGQAVNEAIRAWHDAAEPVLGQDYCAPEPAPEQEVVSRIREILDQEIAPFVAQDGGEIAFIDFDDGEVRLALRGACAGCPSSSITLKMGVEARLREQIPEVTSVVSVDE